ncbi:MAG: substrate-binding domain-containing protein, partial [Bacteroidales bacterium]|nr:substrate-binding domain-containing protein [Bacteroidales bacterium]
SNFQSSVVAGIEKKVNQKGFNLIISQSRESVEKEKANITTMFNSRVDGLLVSLACDTCNLNHLDMFLKKGIPVIFFDRVKDHPDYKCSKVVIDNEKAGYVATEHLIEQGCQRIMFVSDNLMSNVYSERHQGYKKALRHSKLLYDSDLIFVTKLDEESGTRAVEKLLKMKSRPDGIFAANDTSAVSIICQLKHAGIKVPEEIAVVGFNNVHSSRIIDPSLTTIHYPGVEMGEVAASTLIEMLNQDEPVVTKTVVLDHQLIVRKSSLKNRHLQSSS